jgi:pimeloyl-ACP methyl ester carboxylesterase
MAVTGGQLVDVSDFRLYLECMGAGTPTLVFEAPHGGTAAAWDPIWQSAVTLSRACRYDRAGLGRSERSPAPRTIGQLAVELDQLLVSAAVPAPYVLVGHSSGAMIARVFAGRFPHKTAGLVLVDPATEDLGVRMMPFLSEKGQRAFRESWDNPDDPEGLSYARLEEFEADARTFGRRLPDVPLVVLSSRKQEYWASIAPPWWPIEHFMRIGLELHAELARLVPQGTLILAECSGHFIHHDEPELVLDTIRRVLAAARRST